MSEENKNLPVVQDYEKDTENDKIPEKNGGKRMKKVNISLVVALVICLLVIGYMYTLRVGDQLKIDNTEKDVVRLTTELDLLKEEKTKWENDKTVVSKSIGSVRTVLAKTLLDLEEVSTDIGLTPIYTPVPEPTAEPTPEATPESSPEPEVTPVAEPVEEVKETEKPVEETTEEPAATEVVEEKSPTTEVDPTAKP